jgi:DNA mismatch endonuclease (patch repair protein)
MTGKTARATIFVDVPESTRRRMRSIKGKDTKPERTLRAQLHAMGFRFRKNVKGLPGTPDIAIKRRKIAIFVHGCFWHQHDECQQGRVPGTRQEYWLPKLARTVQKDTETLRLYDEMGWAVCVVWECHLTADFESEVSRVAKLLSNHT